MYVYKQCNQVIDHVPGKPWYEVGYYEPNKRWYTESAHDTSEEAVKRVHYLNGGKSS